LRTRASILQNSLEELKKRTSSIEIKQRIDAGENCRYIDSIAVPVSDKLMYDIAKLHHGDDVPLLYKSFYQSRRVWMYLTNEALPMKLTSNILQETH
jgi:hypothetical protein